MCYSRRPVGAVPSVPQLRVQSANDKMPVETCRKIKCPVLLLCYLILELFAPAKATVVQGNITSKPAAVKKMLDNSEDIRPVEFEATICHNETFHDQYVRCKAIDSSIFEPLSERYSIEHGRKEFPADGEYCQMIEIGATDGCSKLSCRVLIKGSFLGMSTLDCAFVTQRTTDESDIVITPIISCPVSVIQSDRKLNRIFIGTLTLMIVIANILMGCELNLQVVINSLKKPIAVAIGLGCQFLLMPVIAYGIAHALLIPEKMYTIALGLFTAGCAPGGGASNFWTLLLKGNADLSITMTFISTLCSLAMMPFWMFALGESLLSGSKEEGTRIVVPYTNIVMNLAILILPLIVGVLFRRIKEDWALKAKKALRPMIIFIMVFILTFGVYANLYMFSLMQWRVLTSGLLLPWCGFMFGCLTALVFRLSHFDVAAISIETGVQNSGVAIMLLKASFEEPVSDISSVVPVVVSLFTPIPLMVAMSLHWIARRKMPKNDKLKEVMQDEKREESKALNGISGSASSNGEAKNGEHQV